MTAHRNTRGALLAAASGYAERGQHVFPCLVGQKRPRWPRWEQRATIDHDLIRRIWARAPFNVGVACGPSGLVVVDLDTPKLGEDPPPGEWRAAEVVDGSDVLAVLARRAGAPWPVTMTVATPRGGRHLVFRAPDGVEVRNSARTVGPWIDVRGHGGYVLGIGSRISARVYRLEVTREPAELPRWLLHLVTQHNEPPKVGGAGSTAAVLARLQLASQGTRAERYAAGVLRSECAELAGMGKGGRNARLNLAAYRAGQLVGAGLLAEDAARQALTAAVRECGLEQDQDHPGEVEKTITSGLNAGVKAPRRIA